MKKKPNLKAFTFAEALVSLVIIGVVAATTIPTLKNHADEQKYVNFAKKSYNEITNAISQAEVKYGDSQFWAKNKAKEYYSEIFDKAPTNQSLEGTIDLSLIGGPYSGGITYDFMTNDGALWSLYDKTFTVDTNGHQPPNVLGIDIYGFKIENNTVVPEDICTKYVIKYSKIPWLKRNMEKCPNT